MKKTILYKRVCKWLSIIDSYPCLLMACMQPLVIDTRLISHNVTAFPLGRLVEGGGYGLGDI